MIAGTLLAYVRDLLALGVEEDLTPESPLIEWGLLDSITMVMLLAHTEQTFGVRIADRYITPDNFENIDALARLVAAQLEVQKAPAVAATPRDALEETVHVLETAGMVRTTYALPSRTQLHTLAVPGDGPTWVLLPGLGNPSSFWAPVLRSLQDENAAVAVDFAGFGLSASPRERPTYHDHLKDALALLDTLNAGPYVLVGSSAGSMIATAVARQCPHDVAALVVTGFGLIETPEAWWSRIQALSRTPDRFMAAAYYHPPHLTPTLRALVDDVFARPAYDSFLEGGGLEALPTTFDGLKVPTLFIAGQEDRIIPQEAVRKAVERVPGAHVEWLARCGHYPAAEQPEELIYFVRDFAASLR